MGVAFLLQRKHEPIIQGGAVPGEAQHGRPVRGALPPAWQMVQGSSAQEEQAQVERIPALRGRSH